MNTLRRLLPLPIATLFLWTLVLLTISFEPLNFYPVIFFGMIPYFRLLEKTRSHRHAVFVSILFGWVFSIGQFYWVNTVLAEFSQLSAFITIPLFLLFAFVAQPQFLLLAVPLRFLVRKLRREENSVALRIAIALIITMLYAGWDWCIPKLFVDTFGLAFSESPRLKQAADIGGPSLLTAIIVFVNISLYLLIYEVKDRSEPSVFPKLKQNLLPLAFSLTCLLTAFLYGENRLTKYLDLEQNAPRKISAAIIQANIGDIEKIAAEKGYRGATKKVMETYYGMSDDALKKYPKTEVLFWPETSYPSDFQSPSSADDFARDRTMIEYAAQVKVPIVFGGYYTDAKKVPYNAAFYLEPTAEVHRYFKSILLWFGETIPGADLFPWIRAQFPMVGFFGRGPGPETIPLLGVKTQPLICYEALFPWFTAEGVRKGAKVILNFTNDSWFGEHGAPYYHFRLAQFRSIETRTPQVRITNTGFSGIVLPSGTVENQSGLFTAEIIPVSIPILADAPPTMIVKFGDWFAGVCVLLSTLGMLWIGYERKKKSA